MSKVCVGGKLSEKEKFNKNAASPKKRQKVLPQINHSKLAAEMNRTAIPPVAGKVEDRRPVNCA